MLDTALGVAFVPVVTVLVVAVSVMDVVDVITVGDGDVAAVGTVYVWVRVTCSMIVIAHGRQPSRAWRCRRCQS